MDDKELTKRVIAQCLDSIIAKLMYARNQHNKFNFGESGQLIDTAVKELEDLDKNIQKDFRT